MPPIPVQPVGTAFPALDAGHLLRQCLGDSALAGELLALFQAQAGLVIAKLRSAALEPDDLARLAHLVKGSAAAIGAMQVVREATLGETTLRAKDMVAGALPAQIALAGTLETACAAIVDYLKTA